MKDIKIKRIFAYVIDIFIVLILVTLLSQINVLNPYKKKYDKAYEKYTEFYEENFSENTTIDYDTLKSPEYLDIMHDLSYYSISYSIIEIVVIILYFTLFPLLFDGQTIGKKICKIKLSSDKGKLTFGSLLIRVLFYPIFTNIILYTTLSNILTLLCVILFKGKIYFYSNLIISIIATIYSYIDILFMINKDVSIHEKLSHTKVELIKGV